MADETPTLDVEKEEAPVEEGTERTRARRCYVPRADIYETENEIVVVADMPGVDESNIDITLEKNVLTINGYLEEEEHEGYSPVYAEYGTGDYTRRFALPDQVDRDRIEAAIQNGVLRLTLPKAGPAVRKIGVKAG